VTPSFALGGVAMAILWASALVSSPSRNRRFLLFLAAASVIVIGGAVLGGLVGRLVEVGVFAIALVALVWPDRFRLSSLDSEDRSADATLRRLGLALDGAAPELHAQTFLTALYAPPFTTPGSPWRTVGRCYRVVLARLGDADTGRSPDLTPLAVFRRAGRHFWQLALDRRVIGRRHEPGAWDEDVLLRCYLDEFDRFVPPGSSLDPFVGRDGWDIEARQRIDEIAGLPLRHRLPMANCRLLRDAIEATLAVALGDHSDVAVDRLRTTSAAIPQQWQAPEEDVAVRVGRHVLQLHRPRDHRKS